MYKYSKDDKVPTGGYSFMPYADTSDPNVYIPPEFEDFVVNVIGAPVEATPDIFFLSVAARLFRACRHGG